MTTQTAPKIRSFARIGAAALVSAALATACGSSSKAPSGGSGGTATTGATSGGDTITIKDFKFNQLSVKPGAKVTVVNKDGAPHSVTDSGSNGFDTGILQKDATATFTAPTTPGSYDYICSVHNYMKGTLVVTS